MDTDIKVKRVEVGNLNGRVGCDVWIHIGRAPVDVEYRAKLPLRVDAVLGSVVVACVLEDVIVFDCVVALPKFFVLLATGGDYCDELARFMAEIGEGKVGVYLYRRIRF